MEKKLKKNVILLFEKNVFLLCEKKMLFCFLKKKSPYFIKCANCQISKCDFKPRKLFTTEKEIIRKSLKNSRVYG